MSKKHTKGPWFVGSMNDAVFIINRKPDHFTDNPVREGGDAVVIATPSMDCPDWEANARLMTASPKLLAALRNFVHAALSPSDYCAICNGDWTCNMAAISEAEGTL